MPETSNNPIVVALKLVVSGLMVVGGAALIARRAWRLYVATSEAVAEQLERVVRKELK